MNIMMMMMMMILLKFDISTLQQLHIILSRKQTK